MNNAPQCFRWLIASSMLFGLTSHGIAATFEYRGTVDTATGAFVTLTPPDTALQLIYVADDAAVANGLVTPGDIESIELSIGQLCFHTDVFGQCTVPGAFLGIDFFDAELTYAAGMPTGGFLEMDSLPPNIAPFFVDIDFTNGTFVLGDAFGAGTASGTLSFVPIPAAVWLFGSAVLGLLRLRRPLRD